jgi:type VI secretion system protein ImpL
MEAYRLDSGALLVVLSVLLLLALLLVIAATILIISRSKSKNSPKNNQDSQDGSANKKGEFSVGFWGRIWGFVHAPTGSPVLSASFKQGIKLLKEYFSRHDFRYRHPWFLLLGEPGTGKTSVLEHCGLNMPRGNPIKDQQVGNRSCYWWLFDHGVVLDIAGDVFLGNDRRTGRFTDLLRLLQWFRPKRPADGVILTIPATDFVGNDRLSPEGLVEKYRGINERLWQMQMTLGMVLPIYVVITKVDAVRGFARFWSQTPPHRQSEIFGWSNPNAPSAMYSDGWIGDAFEELGHSLNGLQLELAVTASKSPTEYDDSFFFPGEFLKLQEPLTLCLAQMFRARSSYDNFTLRGVYFTGYADAADGQVDKTPEVSEMANTDGLNFPKLADSEGIHLPTMGIIPPRELKTPPEVLDKYEENSSPIFFQHLLGNKILREHGLATPLRDAVLSRKRTTRIGQISALLLFVYLGLSLAIYGRELEKSTVVALSTLRSIAQTVTEQRERQIKLKESQNNDAADSPGKRLNLSFLDLQAVEEITKELGRIQYNSFETPFIVWSLFSGIDEKVENFLSTANETVILHAIRSQLNVNTINALAPTAHQRSEPTKNVLAIEDASAFKRLTSLVTNLMKIETLAQKYNGLNKSQSLNDVSELLKELLGQTPGADFFIDSGLYRQALSRIGADPQSPYLFSDHSEGAKIQIRELVHEIYDRVLIRGELDSAMTAVTSELSSFEANHPRMATPGQAALALLKVHRALNHLHRVLNSNAVPFIGRPSPKLKTTFEKLHEFIETSKYFSENGGSFSTELQTIRNDSKIKFRQRLTALNTSVFKPLLIMGEGTVKPKLASKIQNLRELLNELFQAGFMQPAPLAEISPLIPSGRKIIWDNSELNNALDLFEEFEEFLTTRLEAFPSIFRDRVSSVASERVGLLMVRHLKSAIHFTATDTPGWQQPSESKLKIGANQFRRAVPKIERLNTLLQQLNKTEAYESLSGLSVSQASRLLAGIDNLLEREGPYRPAAQDISEWSGIPSAARAAYGLGDDIEAKLYLDFQRERMRNLAQGFAKAPTNYLLSKQEALDGNTRSMVIKWRRVIQELNKYSNRRPDSSVVKLERFIRFDLVRLNIQTCVKLNFQNTIPLRKSDFFINVLNDTRYRIQKRCDELQSQTTAARYNAIAAKFTQQLAGLYPFSSEQGSQREASPQIVTQFFSDNRGEINKTLKAMRSLPKINQQLRLPLKFLEDLLKTDTFFTSITAPDGGVKPKGPRFRIIPEFRINRETEVGGNEIIDWRLENGKNKTILLDKKPALVWITGDPISLKLRWAKDARGRPVISSTGVKDYFLEDGRTATFQYSGQWGAIHLIRSHASTVTEQRGLATVNPHVLEFKVNLSRQPRDDSKTGATQNLSTSRVFVRLVLEPVTTSDKAKGRQLILPTFPAAAPIFSNRPANN